MIVRLIAAAALCLPFAFPAGAATAGDIAPAGRPEPPNPRLVTFIGEQLSVDRLPCRPPARKHRAQDIDASGCTEEDYVFLARYRVLEPLAGEVAGVVEFETTRFRLDEFATSRWALLYVGIAPTRTWLVDGLAEAVYPTADGGWAACGNERLRVPFAPVRLAGDPSFGDVRWMSPRGIENTFPAEIHAVVDGRARCRHGLELPALVDLLEGERARGRENNGWIDQENAAPDP